MSLGAVLFPTGTYRVTRKGRGLFVDGIYQPYDEVDVDVAAIDAGANNLTIPAHGMQTGQGPLFASTTGTLPGGVQSAKQYWALKIDANTIQIMLSPSDVGGIDIQDAGIGTLHLSSSFNIVAGIQPVTGRVLRDLPEGMRAEDTRVVYTTTFLQDVADPDVITVDGELWRVKKVEPYLILAKRYRAWIERLATA